MRASPRSTARTLATAAGVIGVLVVLAACTPSGDPTAIVTDRPSVSASASESPSATPTPTPTSTAPAPEPIPADLKANVIDAMNSGNTAAIDGYLAASVRVTYAASESQADVTNHVQIVNDLTALTADSPTWNFALPASQITGYAAVPSYTDDFPPNSIVGLSSTQHVVSFTVAGGKITRVFIALVEDSLHQ